jgi:hypothetical protein
MAALEKITLKQVKLFFGKRSNALIKKHRAVTGAGV